MKTIKLPSYEERRRITYSAASYASGWVVAAIVLAVAIWMSFY